MLKKADLHDVYSSHTALNLLSGCCSYDMVVPVKTSNKSTTVR